MCEQCWNPHVDRRRALGLMAAGAALPFVRRPSTGHRAPAAQPVPVGSGGLEILPRSAWAQGLEPTGPMMAETVQFLLVHHTAGPTQYDLDFVPGHLRDIYEFHTGPQKGWPDVCYNFFVDRFGRVWEGRAGSLAGPVTADATGGSQGFAQLVCLLGDFTSVMPTPEAILALQRTLAWLADREGIDTSADATTTFVSRGSNRWPAGTSITTPTIAGHRDMSSTECPGNTFYPYVHTELQAAVHALRGAPAPIVAPVPTTVPATPAPVPAAPTSDPTSSTTTTSATTTAPSTSDPTIVASPSTDASVSSTAEPTASAVSSSAPSSTGVSAGATAPTEPDVESSEAQGGVSSGLLAVALGGVAVAAGSFVALRRRDTDRRPDPVDRDDVQPA
jgi:hypothetical protein